MNVVTEIRSFYSIKEINEALEEEIEQYKSVADEYSQWLGSFLRDSEAMQENEEWAKKMGQLNVLVPMSSEEFKKKTEYLYSIVDKYKGYFKD